MTRTLATPACPYCDAVWTDAMLQAFDSHSRGVACGCCVVLPGLELGAASIAPPQHDLCCESCGKPIYYGKPSQT